MYSLLVLRDITLSCIDTEFLHVSLAGVERDYPYLLPGIHIPYMGTFSLQVSLAGV
jgi:hypothetical protein